MILLLIILTFHNLFNVHARSSVNFKFALQRVDFKKEFDQ